MIYNYLIINSIKKECRNVEFVDWIKPFYFLQKKICPKFFIIQGVRGIENPTVGLGGWDKVQRWRVVV